MLLLVFMACGPRVATTDDIQESVIESAPPDDGRISADWAVTCSGVASSFQRAAFAENVGAGSTARPPIVSGWGHRSASYLDYCRVRMGAECPVWVMLQEISVDADGDVVFPCEYNSEADGDKFTGFVYDAAYLWVDGA